MGHYYCKKCGRVVKLHANKKGYLDDTCDYCQSKLFLVPEKYWTEDMGVIISKENEKLLIDELVKTSPEFDEYLFTHRDDDMRRRWDKVSAALDHGKAILEGRDKGNKFGIECPYCHATNVKKISATSKIAYATFLGLFAIGKVGKEWHCNHCNSDF